MAKARRAPVSTIQTVIKDLRDKISLQTILPGARVTEEELANTYDIPRAMAREVLATLEDRGLITRIPNKGAVVAILDMEMIHALYEIREALDGLVVRLATENSKPDDWKDLAEKLGAPLEKSMKDGDIDAFVTTLELFRQRMNEAANSPALIDLIERVQERLRVARRRVALLPGRAEKSIKHYRALLAAIMRGDADAAEQCARELNRSTRADIKRYASYVL